MDSTVQTLDVQIAKRSDTQCRIHSPISERFQREN